MYMLPQIQFATAFDIAGIETGWQDGDGNFVAMPREDMGGSDQSERVVVCGA
jgi:hypothetical protein